MTDLRAGRTAITHAISLTRPAKRLLSLAAQAVYDVLKRCVIEAVKEGRWQGTPLC